MENSEIMEETQKEVTPAQVIFSGKEILTSRPEGMPFDVYKEAKRMQDTVLKKLFAKEPMYKTRRARIKSK